MNGLVKALYQRASDETLMMSMRNVHAMNLFSFVLENNNGALKRIFYTPSNVLEVNFPFSRTMSIGLHNHQYDLVLTGIQGKAISYHYTAHDAVGPDDWALHHYEWSTYAGGHGRHERKGMKAAHLHSSQELRHNQPFYLASSLFHTVWAEAGSAWLVSEGMKYRTQTDLLSHDIGPMAPDMYTRFKDVAEVRRVFEGIFA